MSEPENPRVPSSESASFIRDAERYNRAYGVRPGQEPSQDNTTLRVVLQALRQIGRTIEQVDVTAGDRAILINDDGNRIEIDVWPWETPEMLRPRLEKELEKIPRRWHDADTARFLAADAKADLDAQFRTRFEPVKRGDSGTKAQRLRIERGGLE